MRIKICGVTTPDDVVMCADVGADAIGINFHPGSPRYVDPRQAMPLVRAMPPLMASIGVFVGIPLRQACAIAFQLGLRGVQWHGEQHETGDTFPFSYIPAFRIRDAASLEGINKFLARCPQPPGAVLVDSYVDGVEGGTGMTAPWHLLADYRPAVPLILAGGLKPENVAEAIQQVHPWAVDVASGVESSPGRKDASKVRDFVAAAKAAAS